MMMKSQKHLHSLLVAIGFLFIFIYLKRIYFFYFLSKSEFTFVYKQIVFSFCSILFVIASLLYNRQKLLAGYLYSAFLGSICLVDAIENYYFYSTNGYGKQPQYIYLIALSISAIYLSLRLSFLVKKKASNNAGFSEN